MVIVMFVIISKMAAHCHVLLNFKMAYTRRWNDVVLEVTQQRVLLELQYDAAKYR